MALGITLAKLLVPIEAQTEKFESGLGKAQSMVKGFASTAQRIGTAALKGIGIAGAAAVTGIAAVGGAIVKLASDAAPLVNVKAAFEGVAEAAGTSGEAMLAAFDKATGGMVSHEDAMKSFNKAASLVSKDFAVELPNAMQYLGKVSAATGEDMGFLLNSLVVGVGRLSPMILDNLGIQASLSEATERAAEMFGVEASALSKTQIQAGMMAVVVDKLKESTAAMPDVTQSAAAKMEALKTSFKNTKDEIGMALVPALGSLLDGFQPIISRALPALVKIVQDKVVPIIEKAANWIGTLIEIAYEWYQAMRKGKNPIEALGDVLSSLGFEDLGEKIKEVKGRIDEFIDKVREIWNTIQPFISTIWEWIQQNVELKDVLIALGAAILAAVIPAIIGFVTAAAPVVLVFAAIIAVVALLRSIWEEHGDAIKAKAEEIWGGIKEFVSTAITVIQEVVTTVVEAIREFWAENGEAILAKAQEIWQGIQTAIQVAIEIIKTIIETVLGVIRSLWDQHGAQVMALVQAFWGFIQALYDAAVKFITGIIDMFKGDQESKWTGLSTAIKTIVDTLWKAVNVLFDTALKALKTLFDIFAAVFRGDWDAAWDGVKTYFETIWEGIKKFFGTLLDGIMKIFEPWIGDIKTAWETWLDGIKTWWTTTWNDIKSAAETVWGVIEGAFSSFKDGIDNVAGKVADAMGKVSGAIDSISSAIQSAIDWIANIIAKIGELAGIVLPGWITGHSPPPLANWIQAIGEASKYAAKELQAEFSPQVRNLRGMNMAADVAPMTQSIREGDQFNITVHTAKGEDEILYSYEIAKALAGAA